jgi:hypothetical protein
LSATCTQGTIADLAAKLLRLRPISCGGDSGEKDRPTTFPPFFGPPALIISMIFIYLLLHIVIIIQHQQHHIIITITIRPLHHHHRFSEVDKPLSRCC